MEINVKITGLEDLTQAIVGWTDALQALQMPRVNAVVNHPEQSAQTAAAPATAQQPVNQYPNQYQPQAAATQQQQQPVNVVPAAQFAPHPEAAVTQQPYYPPQQAAAPAMPQGAIPTAAPLYTQDLLAVAATQLVDAGKRQELLALLASFGVQSLLRLPKEQYGNFATQLRAMGAKI